MTLTPGELQLGILRGVLNTREIVILLTGFITGVLMMSMWTVLVFVVWT